MFTPRIGTRVDEFGGAQYRVPSPPRTTTISVSSDTHGGCTPKSGAPVLSMMATLKTGHSAAGSPPGHYGSGLPEPGMRHHHRVALGHGILLSIRSHCSIILNRRHRHQSYRCSKNAASWRVAGNVPQSRLS